MSVIEIQQSENKKDNNVTLVTNRDNKMFFDANLYISVFSELEELLISTSNSVHKAMYSSDDYKKSALQDVLNITDLLENDVEEKLDIDINDNEEHYSSVQELITLCMKHCTDMHEHLLHICKSVIDFLINKHYEIKSILNDTEIDFEYMKTIKHNWENKLGKSVESEYKIYLLKLNKLFEERIVNFYNDTFEKPDTKLDIIKSGKNVQDTFLSLSKKVSSKTLKTIRKNYDSELKMIEKKVAKVFCDSTKRWLHSIEITCNINNHKRIEDLNGSTII
tara:strand:- start:332 stop:1165 length:834 start_codon:yes stop_codon:yes gene_type:complete